MLCAYQHHTREEVMSRPSRPCKRDLSDAVHAFLQFRAADQFTSEGPISYCTC